MDPTSEMTTMPLNTNAEKDYPQMTGTDCVLVSPKVAQETGDNQNVEMKSSDRDGGPKNWDQAEDDEE